MISSHSPDGLSSGKDALDGQESEALSKKLWLASLSRHLEGPAFRSFNNEVYNCGPRREPQNP